VDTNVFGYFIAVERYGSYARAARDLGISPQGLSSAIRRLETELGVPLVDTRLGHISLTKYGRYFLEGARRMDGDFREMRQGLEAMATHDANIVEVGCALGIIGYLGEDVIERFNATSNAQALLTDELPDAECERRLLDGSYDVCLMTSPVSIDGLIAVPIVCDYQFLWVSTRNPLSRKDELSVTDLDGQTVVTLREGYKSTPAFLQLCDDVGVEVEMRYTSEMMRVYELARAARGLGLTCRNHVEATSDSSATVGIPFKSLPWGICACYLREKPLSAAAASFVDFLKTLRRKYS
jgi:DNA-binding transcriptional LysR family regulator